MCGVVDGGGFVCSLSVRGVVVIAVDCGVSGVGGVCVVVDFVAGVVFVVECGGRRRVDGDAVIAGVVVGEDDMSWGSVCVLVLLLLLLMP